MKPLLQKETEMDYDIRIQSESKICDLLFIILIVRFGYLALNNISLDWFELSILFSLTFIKIILTLYYQKKMIGDIDSKSLLSWSKFTLMMAIGCILFFYAVTMLVLKFLS